MVLHIIMAAALLTVLATLVLGMINLLKIGPEARMRSNVLMRWRVGAQAIAFGVFILVIYIKKQNGG